MLQVVGVKMEIAKSVDKIAGHKLADLGDHQGEKGVTGDIKRDPKEQVRAALIKLATEPTVRHVKLKKCVARREGHLLDLADVPCAHNMPPARRIILNLRDDLPDLVDGTAVGCPPITPLRPINPAEVSRCIGPLVPDCDPVLAQISDVGFPA